MGWESGGGGEEAGMSVARGGRWSADGCRRGCRAVCALAAGGSEMMRWGRCARTVGGRLGSFFDGGRGIGCGMQSLFFSGSLDPGVDLVSGSCCDGRSVSRLLLFRHPCDVGRGSASCQVSHSVFDRPRTQTSIFA